MENFNVKVIYKSCESVTYHNIYRIESKLGKINLVDAYGNAHAVSKREIMTLDVQYKMKG